MPLDAPKSDTAIIEEAFTINDALGIDDIATLREAMRANYSALQDFPPVVRKGSYAYVTLDDGQVCGVQPSMVVTTSRSMHSLG